jgi:hypothetical protein
VYEDHIARVNVMAFNPTEIYISVLNMTRFFCPAFQVSFRIAVVRFSFLFLLVRRVWLLQFLHSTKMLYNWQNNFKNFSETVYDSEKITANLTRPIKGEEQWNKSFLQIVCPTIHILNYLHAVCEDLVTFY